MEVNATNVGAQGATLTEVRPAWLTYREAEVYSSLSRTTLWRMVSSDKVRAARIGKAVRIERRSLEEFLAQSVSHSTPAK